MNKPKQKINTLDVLISNLATEFSKIPNFDLIEKDSMANRIFNIISFRLADIASYKELVIHHFIPETNKAIANSKEMVRTSQFRNLLHIKDGDYEETAHQTIRLAYVGLFHKMESFLNDILKMEEIFSEGDVYPETLEKFAKKEFGFQFRDWQQFSATAKINWICNCVKHYDGFPEKEPRPANCRLFPSGKRLQLSAKEFRLDTEHYLQFNSVYLSIMFLMSSYRRYANDFNYEFWKDNKEMILSHEETVLKMKKVITDMIDKMRETERNIDSLYLE